MPSIEARAVKEPASAIERVLLGCAAILPRRRSALSLYVC